MFRKPGYYILLALIVGLVSIPFQVLAFGHSDKKTASVVMDQKPQAQLLAYTSNQFTQPEQKKTHETNQVVSLKGFVKIAENTHLILYLDKKSLALKIKNKKTGYVWNSGVDDPAKHNLNIMWGQLANSALTIDYVDRYNKLQTESILTNQSESVIQKVTNGFMATIDFSRAAIKVQLVVKLAGDRLTVFVPEKGIQEGMFNKLVDMKVYPFLGAEYKGQMDGYMFIPDGSGALIRYQNSGVKADAPFTSSYFGDDAAFEKTPDTSTTDTTVTPPQQIKMPVYGVVQGVKQNGFLAVVESGDNYGQLIAYPSGVTTDYNWITSSFNYRYQYFQPTSQSSAGVNLYQTKMNKFDIKLRFTFLENQEADYVGMAKAYQNYLVQKGDLVRHASGQPTVRLEFLGGETKKGLLWNSVVPMTKITDLSQNVQALRSSKVQNMMVVYKGWSAGGLTGTLPEKFPFERKLGNKTAVQTTIQTLKQEGVPLYFYTDYTKAYNGAKGYRGSRDVARKISSETILNMDDVAPYYYLSPSKSLNLAKSDVSDYKNYGMANLAIDTTSYTTFSDYNRQSLATRKQTTETYAQIFNLFNKDDFGLAMYQPNVTAWKAMKAYLDVPMFSSNYSYMTDTVPFVEIVLKGYVPYYAPFSNFNADPQDDVLRMIDYGAYPSFLLTTQPSNLLKDTPSADIYTSQFDVWKKEIIREYQMVKKSLGNVEGQTIESREVLSSGVVKVTYSNGTSIIVNYTETPFTDQPDHVTIKAKNFVVVDGKVTK